MPLYANITQEFEDKVIEVFKESQSNLCRIQCMIMLGTSDSGDGTSGTATDSGSGLGDTGWSIGGSGSASGEKSGDSSADSGEIVPMKLHTFTITQHFEKEYMEKITATLDLSLEEAIKVVSNYQDLKCNMIIDHVTQHYYRVIDDIEPEVKDFKVLINSPEDLKKKLLAVEQMVKRKIEEAKERGEAVPDDLRILRYNLPVELVTEERYMLRERPTNFILEEADLKTAIHMFANAQGITKVSMVDPDNPKKYKNIIAPPMQTMGSFIMNLQNTYGIYKKGIGYYFDDKDKVLRIYPSYETDPQIDEGQNAPEVTELALWRVPNGAYPGNSSYHNVSGSTMEIILNGEMGFKDLSEMGVELNGNLQIATRSDTAVDVNTEQKGKEADVKEDNQLLVGPENENLANKDRVVAKYNDGTNNSYEMAANMASTMCIAMSATWDMAWPWIITSGLKLTYNFEDEEGIKDTTGQVVAVEYNAVAIAGVITHELYYAWKAVVSCRLAPAQKEEQQAAG